MELLTFATQKVVPFTLLFLAVLGAYVCWRAKSWHPVNLRLLRLFIARDDIKDSDIAGSLDDASSVASFRMAHGIAVETLADAKRVAQFAKKKNIPLYLIGRAGYGFNVKTLELRHARQRIKSAYALPWVAAIVFGAAALFALYVATNKDLMILFKQTGTWVQFGPSEATLRERLLIGPSVVFRRSSCNGAVPTEEKEDSLSADRRILCEIWAHQDLQPDMAKELSDQRTVFSAVAAVAFGYAFGFVALLREWFGQTRLRKLLHSHA